MNEKNTQLLQSGRNCTGTSYTLNNPLPTPQDRLLQNDNQHDGLAGMEWSMTDLMAAQAPLEWPITIVFSSTSRLFFINGSHLDLTDSKRRKIRTNEEALTSLIIHFLEIDHTGTGYYQTLQQPWPFLVKKTAKTLFQYFNIFGAYRTDKKVGPVPTVPTQLITKKIYKQ
jgi:hypothetical protein